MDVDEALNSLSVGRCGKWQVIFYNLVCISCCFTGAWQMFAINFIGADVDHHCRLPNGTDLNTSVPLITTDGVTKISSCHIYSNYSSETNTTESCPDGWQYKEGQRYTIAQKWNLVCDQAYLVGGTQTMLMVGVMVGEIVCTNLADIFGRKPVFIVALVGAAIIGITSSAMHNFYAFMFLRFLTGFFQQGYMLVGFVLACEMVPAQVRTEAGMMFMNWWAFGMCLLAGIAYLTPAWYTLMLALSAPGFLYIIFIWILPRSVPWLVAKGRILEAKVILRDIAKFNGYELPLKFQLTAQDREKFIKDKKWGRKENTENTNTGEELANVTGVKYTQNEDKEDKGNAEDRDHTPMPRWMRRASSKFVQQFEPKGKDGIEHKYTILDIIRSPTLRTYTIILCYLFMVNQLVYYGLSLNTGNLAGDMYLNFFLSGLVEIPANTIAMFVLKYVGRRLPICIFHFIAGVPLLITLAIPETTASGVSLVPLIVALSMIGKFGVTASFDSLFLWGAELYPTTIRNIGLGITGVLGTTGSILAPFSVFAAKLIWWFPSVVFGVMCLLGGFACLALPETHNRPLPQTIEEVENLRQQK